MTGANDDEIVLPRGLLEAVALFEDCDELVEIFGKGFVSTYRAIKQAEFETFMQVISHGSGSISCSMFEGRRYAGPLSAKMLETTMGTHVPDLFGCVAIKGQCRRGRREYPRCDSVSYRQAQEDRLPVPEPHRAGYLED